MPLASGGSVNAFKSSFFDAEVVLKAMDKAERKALSKFGAFVRQRARTSIRYRKASAPVGSPPSGHRTQTRKKTNRKTGATKIQQVSPLREFIFFAYDAQNHLVIIGPALLNGSRQQGGKTIPQTLEEGGAAELMRNMLRPGFRRKRLVRIGKHAYMNPALKAELSKLMPEFKDSMTA